jgi:Tol biopolymer transport system component
MRGIRKSILLPELAAVSVLSAPAIAQLTQRVSLSSAGDQENGNSFTHERVDAGMSADGRYVAFWSAASNLVPNDTNGVPDVFVRDRLTGTTQRISVASNGGEADGESRDPSISADGRYVAFWSHATNLVPDDTNGHADVFVHDRQTSTIVRASVDSNGNQASDHSFFPSLSADGRYVAFESSAPDLVAGDGNGLSDVFVRDLVAGTTERVSLDSSGAEGDGDSGLASISPDGRFVAFESFATNLVAGDVNGCRDVFVRDRSTGTTERASVDSSGVAGDGDSRAPAVSADGRYVAFESAASNLVPGDTNGHHDVFVRDRVDGITTRVSVDSAGGQANDDSINPSISGDGRFVAFTSVASNLVAGDTNDSDDIFLRDRTASTTERVSVDSGGRQANGQSADAWISADGSRVVFGSTAAILDPADTNDLWDVFVRDRAFTAMTSLCDPGALGVAGCPCSNAPARPGRGCDNSSRSGGAALSAVGGAFLSSDSLAFTTTGEIPNALSMLVQGSAETSAGAVFGRGVRCAGGVLRTLYTKTAVQGSITAPDFGNGDPSVSTRSQALGDAIQPGETRWYFVAYRDPIGVCPAQLLAPPRQAFNATQTGRVTWGP